MKKIIDTLDAKLIYELKRRGFTQDRIALLFNVSTSTINKILNTPLDTNTTIMHRGKFKASI